MKHNGRVFVENRNQYIRLLGSYSFPLFAFSQSNRFGSIRKYVFWMNLKLTKSYGAVNVKYFSNHSKVCLLTLAFAIEKCKIFSNLLFQTEHVMTYHKCGMLMLHQLNCFGQKMWYSVQFISASRPSTKYFIGNTGPGSDGRSCHLSHFSDEYWTEVVCQL